MAANERVWHARNVLRIMELCIVSVGANCLAKLVAVALRGNCFEKDGSKGTLPSFLKDSETSVGEESFGWVEKAILSWIDFVDLEQCNLLCK